MQYVKCDETKVNQLCDKFLSSIRKFNPDCIVPIMQGGIIPAKKIADMLKLTDLYPISIKKYNNDGKKLHSAIVEKSVGSEIIDKRVLIVDDVVETGDTMQLAINEVKQHTRYAMACCLIAKEDTWVDIRLGVDCPYAEIYKQGEWVKFYWEDGY